MPAAVTGTALALFNFLFIFGGSLGSAATGAMADVLPLSTAEAVVALLPLAGVALATGMRPPHGPPGHDDGPAASSAASGPGGAAARGKDPA